MPEVKNVVFCLNGTWSTQRQLRFSESIVGYFASLIMFNPYNSVLNIYKNCTEKSKYYFDGPGTDLFEHYHEHSGIKQLWSAIRGGADGHAGHHGITATLLKIKSIIRDESKSGEPLAIHLFTWSRGGYLAWRLNGELNELIDEGITIDSMRIHNIDPVVGTPIDRIKFSQQPNPTHSVVVTVTNYYSHTGNLSFWDNFVTPMLNINTPFLSGLIFESGYIQNNYLVAANHEGIAGQYGGYSDDHPEKIAGAMVLGHILSESSIAFSVDWKSGVLNAYKDARVHHSIRIDTMNSQRPERLFLHREQLTHCFFGKSMQNEFKTLMTHQPQDDLYASPVKQLSDIIKH